jgi:hypothetical protein
MRPVSQALLTPTGMMTRERASEVAGRTQQRRLHCGQIRSPERAGALYGSGFVGLRAPAARVAN